MTLEKVPGVGCNIKNKIYYLAKCIKWTLSINILYSSKSLFLFSSTQVYFSLVQLNFNFMTSQALLEIYYLLFS